MAKKHIELQKAKYRKKLKHLEKCLKAAIIAYEEDQRINGIKKGFGWFLNDYHNPFNKFLSKRKH